MPQWAVSVKSACTATWNTGLLSSLYLFCWVPRVVLRTKEHRKAHLHALQTRDRMFHVFVPTPTATAASKQLDPFIAADALITPVMRANRPYTAQPSWARVAGGRLYQLLLVRPFTPISMHSNFSILDLTRSSSWHSLNTSGLHHWHPGTLYVNKDLSPRFRPFWLNVPDIKFAILRHFDRITQCKVESGRKKPWLRKSEIDASGNF